MPRKNSPPDKKDILNQLSKLAFGKANDCVALVMDESPSLRKLDLDLLASLKKGKDGAVEIRLVDRLDALRELSALLQEDEEGAEAFLAALSRSRDDD